MQHAFNEHVTAEALPRGRGASNGTLVAWVLRRLAGSLRELGPRGTLGLVRKNLAYGVRQYVNRRFDRRFRVETSGVTLLETLTCDSANKQHGVWYEPTPLRTLRCMFSMLPQDLSDFTFIDFGSGKGRTLLYASNYGFRRIIGVEFAQELHSIAERNIRTYRNRNQRCTDIRSICMDAVKFGLPEENCVLYFFHPFREEVMQKVLENITEWHRRHAKKLVILYYHPQLNAMLGNVPFLRKRQEQPVPFDLSAEPCIYRRRLALYEAVATEK